MGGKWIGASFGLNLGLLEDEDYIKIKMIIKEKVKKEACFEDIIASMNDHEASEDILDCDNERKYLVLKLEDKEIEENPKYKDLFGYGCWKFTIKDLEGLKVEYDRYLNQLKEYGLEKYLNKVDLHFYMYYC